MDKFDDESEYSGNKGTTFIIRILDKQNQSWQGRLTWVEENKTKSFRSSLELLTLIDSVVKQNVIESKLITNQDKLIKN